MMVTIIVILSVVMMTLALARMARHYRRHAEPPARQWKETLEPISKQNISEVRCVSVNDDQSGYVANITDSLIQASFLAQHDWHGFALRASGQVVGFASYARYARGGFKIYKMMIDKDHQGCGLGTRLLDMIVHEIQKNNRGAPIYIEVHTENAVALHIYAKRFDTVSITSSCMLMVLRE
jgi:diamine N-acetyltransferase